MSVAPYAPNRIIVVTNDFAARSRAHYASERRQRKSVVHLRGPPETVAVETAEQLLGELQRQLVCPPRDLHYDTLLYKNRPTRVLRRFYVEKLRCQAFLYSEVAALLGYAKVESMRGLLSRAVREGRMEAPVELNKTLACALRASGVSYRRKKLLPVSNLIALGKIRKLW